MKIIPLFSEIKIINKVEYVPTLFPKTKGGWAIQNMRKDKLKNDPRVIHDSGISHA